MPASPYAPHQVVATHRQFSLWYPLNRISEQMDVAHLQRVTVICADDSLLWRLDGLKQQVMLIPFGIEGEGDLRRELQALPGFDIDLLFSYLDERTDAKLPLQLWQS